MQLLLHREPFSGYLQVQANWYGARYWPSRPSSKGSLQSRTRERKIAIARAIDQFQSDQGAYGRDSLHLAAAKAEQFRYYAKKYVPDRPGLLKEIDNSQLTLDNVPSKKKKINPSHQTLNDIPNKIVAIILSYLTFKEKCCLGRTNIRMRALSMMSEFWRLIRIPNQILNYTLIPNIIAMGTQFLSIPWCSVQGNWSEYMDLKNFLRNNVSDLEYLDLSGCNGSGTCNGDDSMAALLVSRSKKLAVPDLSTLRLTLIKTIMNKLTCRAASQLWICPQSEIMPTKIYFSTRR